MPKMTRADRRSRDGAGVRQKDTAQPDVDYPLPAGDSRFFRNASWRVDLQDSSGTPGRNDIEAIPVGVVPGPGTLPIVERERLVSSWSGTGQAVDNRISRARLVFILWEHAR